MVGMGSHLLQETECHQLLGGCGWKSNEMPLSCKQSLGPWGMDTWVPCDIPRYSHFRLSTGGKWGKMAVGILKAQQRKIETVMTMFVWSHLKALAYIFHAVCQIYFHCTQFMSCEITNVEILTCKPMGEGFRGLIPWRQPPGGTVFHSFFHQL